MFFCGNGGSAADAQHLAAELTGRYYKDRPPLPAEALHVNTSFLTAVANDYSYEEVFARLLRAWGRKGDVLWAMSTSGNSPNVLRAIQEARQLGMVVVGLTGAQGARWPASAITFSGRRRRTRRVFRRRTWWWDIRCVSLWRRRSLGALEAAVKRESTAKAKERGAAGPTHPGRRLRRRPTYPRLLLHHQPQHHHTFIRAQVHAVQARR